MTINPIALAIPFFLILIGIELLVQRRQGKQTYRLNDAVTDLSCGVGQQVLGVFLRIALVAGYGWLYQRAPFQLGADSGWAWAIALVGVDFLYYWWHRLSHRVNFLWAVHVVHHQSEDYNLAVALRQAWLSGLTVWAFYGLLALAGIPPLVIVTSAALNTLYQFWIHTETVGRMGPLEWVLNTPSHHRVHHGINPQYIDRNHAGVLIIWDRMFGTFEPEGDPVVYGTVTPFGSWNPIWANFDYWTKLARDAYAAPRWADKLKVWFMRPGWRPRGLGPHEEAPPVSRESFVKWDLPATRGLGIYVASQYAPTIAATFLLLWFEKRLTLPAMALVSGLSLLSVFSFGALFEGRRWALAVELGRLTTLCALAVGYLGVALELPVAAAVAVVLLAASAWWALRVSGGKPGDGTKPLLRSRAWHR